MYNKRKHKSRDKTSDDTYRKLFLHLCDGCRDCKYSWSLVASKKINREELSARETP